MSLPLTRRIARTALLLAAGAAPVVAAAGTASAAVAPTAVPVTRADAGGLNQSVDGATHSVGGTAAKVGGQVADKVAPGTGGTVEGATKAATSGKVGADAPSLGGLPLK